MPRGKSVKKEIERIFNELKEIDVSKIENEELRTAVLNVQTYFEIAELLKARAIIDKKLEELRGTPKKLN